jgi:hypothetical protein
MPFVIQSALLSGLSAVKLPGGLYAVQPNNRLNG